jgi:hypothetical protein
MQARIHAARLRFSRDDIMTLTVEETLEAEVRCPQCAARMLLGTECEVRAYDQRQAVTVIKVSKPHEEDVLVCSDPDCAFMTDVISFEQDLAQRYYAKEEPHGI